MNEYLLAKNPDKKYSPAAFWFLYGHIDGDEMCRQADMMYDQGVYQAFMHPRAFLETPYLSDEWWEAIGKCVKHCAETGFLSWLYDEYAWPSGTCGSTMDDGVQTVRSKTLEKGEQNHGKDAYMSLRPEEGDTVLCTYYTDKPDDWQPEALSTQPFEGSTPLYLVRHVKPDMVDYLNPATIRDFLDCTHEEYKKRYGEYFGKSIPGIFYDEIYITARPQAWTDRLPELFSEKYGYDLMPVMPYLYKGMSEKAKQVRTDYYTLVAELYEKAFFQQIGEWCADNNLILTGHTEEYFTSHANNQGHFFNTQRHMQMPGSDCHDYRYRLPRIISKFETRYAVSASRLYNKERAMSEALGGAGWGCSLQEYKRGISVMGAMGISFFTLHGFHYSLEAQGSQADWPASFFYQNPYWPYFKSLADYIRRVSYMNAIGRADVKCGLFYSVEQTYRYTLNGRLSGDGFRFAEMYDKALCALLENQIDTDAIDRPGLFRGTVADGRFCVGSQKFSCLVFPAGIEGDDELVKRINEIRAQGVKVVLGVSSFGETPNAQIEADAIVPLDELPETVTALGARDVTVLEGDKNEFYINHRVCEKGEHFMLSNGLDEKRSYKLLLSAHGECVGFDPENGRTFPLDAEDTPDGIRVSVTLNADSAVYVLVNTGLETEEKARPQKGEYRLVLGQWRFIPVQGDQLWNNEVELELPVARFAAEGQAPRDIRIMNTPKEPGSVKRHVSNWHAKWIARRQGWRSNSEASVMYFRKTLTLPAAPERAQVCIAAVNSAEVCINGNNAFAFESREQAGVFDISAFLKAGENLIAVRVENTTPGDDDYTQARYLPHNRIISLLMEGDIVAGGKKIPLITDESWISAVGNKPEWSDPDAVIEVFENDSRRATNFRGYPEMNDKQWLYAWSRGELPLHPFGNLPLFGKTVEYPIRCAYTFMLPVGTDAVYAPCADGITEVLVDGMEAAFDGEGKLSLATDGRMHVLTVKVLAENETYGIHRNLKVHVVPQKVNLGSWSGLGLDWYAGRARYENYIGIHKKEGKRYLLTLGDVRFNAEVYVNGVKAGVKVWAPYELEITDLVRDGRNDITVIVANSAAVERRYMNVDEGRPLGWNYYWNKENIEREPKNLVSGLLGEVRLYEC